MTQHGAGVASVDPPNRDLLHSIIGEEGLQPYTLFELVFASEGHTVRWRVQTSNVICRRFFPTYPINSDGDCGIVPDGYYLEDIDTLAELIPQFLKNRLREKHDILDAIGQLLGIVVKKHAKSCKTTFNRRKKRLQVRVVYNSTLHYALLYVRNKLQES